MQTWNASASLQSSGSFSTSLDRFLLPESIAVIGSFKEGWFGGYILLRDLIQGSFKGRVLPVNPKYRNVLGVEVFPEIRNLDVAPDLAVIIRAREAVPGVLEECGVHGIRAVVVVSDGFAERDERGRFLQQEMLRVARRHSMRIMGPNTIGVINTWNGLTTVPYEKGYPKIPRGPVALISQSGLAGPQALELADLNIGISKIIDLGNMCDVDETECLEYLETDRDTRVISMYMENVRRGRAFLEAARRITRKKPILCMKSGRSESGAAAMASHTGSLAGADIVYESVFRQAGVTRVQDFRELLTLAKALSLQPLPGGNRLGLVSITGGGGIMALDCAEASGLVRADLAPDSRSKLEDLFPSLGANPVDIGPAAAATGTLDVLYREAIRIMSRDEGVDCIFCALYDTPLLNPSFYRRVFEELDGDLVKPLVAWAYGTSRSRILELSATLEERGIPVYTDITTAVRALGVLVRHTERSRDPA